MNLKITIPTLIILIMAMIAPPSAIAVGPPVCGFYGSVQNGGQNVPDGTSVTAMIDGEAVGTYETKYSGYWMIIPGDYDGKDISFFIGEENLRAMETCSWSMGNFSNLDLHIAPRFGPSIAGYCGIVMNGTEPVPAGSEINAWTDGNIVATAEIQDYGGTSVYSIQFEGWYWNEKIEFTLGEQYTYLGQTAWEAGSFERLDFNSEWSCFNFDGNQSNTIEQSEMVTALMEYLTFRLSYARMVEVLMCFLTH